MHTDCHRPLYLNFSVFSQTRYHQVAPPARKEAGVIPSSECGDTPKKLTRCAMQRRNSGRPPIKITPVWPMLSERASKKSITSGVSMRTCSLLAPKRRIFGLPMRTKAARTSDNKALGSSRVSQLRPLKASGAWNEMRLAHSCGSTSFPGSPSLETGSLH